MSRSSSMGGAGRWNGGDNVPGDRMIRAARWHRRPSIGHAVGFHGHRLVLDPPDFVRGSATSLRRRERPLLIGVDIAVSGCPPATDTGVSVDPSIRPKIFESEACNRGRNRRYCLCIKSPDTPLQVGRQPRPPQVEPRCRGSPRREHAAFILKANPIPAGPPECCVRDAAMVRDGCRHGSPSRRPAGRVRCGRPVRDHCAHREPPE